MVLVRAGSTLRSLSRLCLVIVLTSPVPALAHPGGHGGAAAGGVSHAGAGIVTLRPDDLKLSVDFFGYLSGSATSGWRSGEPLGAGGKVSLFYNNYLAREAPFERAGLMKKDYWPQYRDFSYNPLWQPSQLGVRTQYRFVPTLRGTVTAVYFGSIDQVTPEPNAIEIEELLARWTPESAPGLSVSFGRLLLVGSYAAPFDQFPLEGFQFNGAAVSYERPLGGSRLRGQIAGGRIPLGRSTAVEPINPELPFHPAFLDALRERTHIYATAGVQLANGFSLGLISGYQVLPEDQSSNSDSTPTTRVWPQSSGWHVGVEAGLDRPGHGHHLYVTQGKGDVEMAWSAPDYIYVLDASGQYDRFTRKGSALFQTVYWGYLALRRLGVAGGAWFQWRSPTKDRAHLQRLQRDHRTARAAADTHPKFPRRQVQPRADLELRSSILRSAAGQHPLLRQEGHHEYRGAAGGRGPAASDGTRSSGRSRRLDCRTIFVGTRGRRFIDCVAIRGPSPRRDPPGAHQLVGRLVQQPHPPPEPGIRLSRQPDRLGLGHLPLRQRRGRRACASEPERRLATVAMASLSDRSPRCLRRSACRPV